jgi:prophage DNA circulation protein
MAWQDQLQKASFRGVEFQVEGDDAAFGRRVQLHEYPQRDKPYVEDMGRKAREVSLTAFLVGPDYMAARDKLLAAVEQAGPGELVHPWYGRLTVSIKDDGCRVTHSRDDGGVCRIRLTFIESGEKAFPAAGTASGAKTLLAADALEQLSTQQFAECFALDVAPAWVGADALATAEGMLGTLDRVLSGGILASPGGSLLGELGALLGVPQNYATRLFGLFNKASALVQRRLVGADFSTANYHRASSAVCAANQFPPAARATTITPAPTRLYDNRDALAAVHRRAALVQASAMTATMPLPVFDDAVALRSSLLATLDSEAALADDVAYVALSELRTQVHRDMGARIRAAARLRDYAPPEVLPALAVAYDLYEDTAREDEIVARNRIRHPGFVPPAPIKVLSA